MSGTNRTMAQVPGSRAWRQALQASSDLERLVSALPLIGSELLALDPADGKGGPMLKASLDDVATFVGGGGGSGDVVGPASATNNALVRFDTTTGKLIQDSNVLLSDTDLLMGLTGVSITTPDTANNVSLTITNNDTTNDTVHLVIDGASLGQAVFIDKGTGALVNGVAMGAADNGIYPLAVDALAMTLGGNAGRIRFSTVNMRTAGQTPGFRINFLGGASTPTYAASADNNTGLNLGGSDDWSLVSGGTASLSGDASNNVTIDNGILFLNSYTVATLPSATVAAGFIYVSDETGGATMAFSEGTNWRRVQDRAIVA